MKKLLFIISVFVIIMGTNVVYATEAAPETDSDTETVSDKYDVNAVLDNPDATDTELLRAILVCIKDIDIFVQFFVTLVFAIGLTYFVVLKPLRYFLY